MSILSRKHVVALWEGHVWSGIGGNNSKNPNLCMTLSLGILGVYEAFYYPVLCCQVPQSSFETASNHLAVS